MKKFLLIVTIFVLTFTLAGCAKKDDNNTSTDNRGAIFESAEQVDKEVRGWTVYTNPQYRYELRHPKSWTYKEDSEGGNIVAFYPKSKTLSNEYVGEIIIRSQSNWQKSLSLEEYYKTEAVNNYFTLGFESQPVTVGEYSGYWIKDVEHLYGDKKIQIIAIQANDRILEIQLIDMTNQEALTVFNSLKFYGNVNYTF